MVTTHPLAHAPDVCRRPRLVALATLGTAVTLLASDVIDPVGEGTAENFEAAATEHEAMLVTSAILLLVSAVLLVPAVAGMVARMPRRGSVVGHVGAALLVLGAFGHAMAATFSLVVSAVPGGPVGAAQMRALVDHLNQSANLVVAFVCILAFSLGVLLAFVGLHRAGVVPTWVLAAVVLAFVLEMVAPGGIVAVSVTKQALGVLAFAFLAVQLWRRGPAVSPDRAAASGRDAAPPHTLAT